MAQARDPFEPLIDPNAPVGVPGDPVPGTDPDSAPPFQPSEPMPNTGADTSSWFGLAYALIAIGAGMVVLGRLYRNPVGTRRRS
jgi:LPXTG-motif cell wall-anchored protein